MARDLTVSFDPPLEERDDDDLIRRSILDRYRLGIPALGPGQELTNIVTFDSKDESKNDLAAKINVKIVYRGGKWNEDAFPLVAEVYRHHTYQTSLASQEEQIKKIQVSVKAMAASLNKLASAASSGGRETGAIQDHFAFPAQHEALRARLVPPAPPGDEAEEGQG
ncbi:hypothetical protein [Oerskovia enterophila]|uniref:hypothetical protein n=1 Tax=Oerskovia enterophila TaxID=43678 RepID=UPI003397C0BE